MPLHLSYVVDLTLPGSSSASSSNQGTYNPPSGVNIPSSRKRNNSLVTITGHKLPPPPPPVVVDLAGDEDRGSRKKRKVMSSQQGSSAGSSRSGSRAQSNIATSSRGSASRPAPTLIKFKEEDNGTINLCSDDEDDGVINLCSDDEMEVDEVEVVGMAADPPRQKLHPMSPTPDLFRPPSPVASVPAFTSWSNRHLSSPRGQVAPGSGTSSRAPPPRVRFPVFEKIDNPGVLFDRVVLESLETAEDYENLVPGLNLENPNLWKPIQTNPNRMSPLREDRDESDNESVDSEAAEDESEELAWRRLHELKRPYSDCPGPALYDRAALQTSHLLRDKLQNCSNYNRRTFASTVRVRKLTSLPGDWDYIRPPLAAELGFDRLRLTASFKQCPGSIVSIDQSNGHIVAAGGCIGGGVDAPDEARDPYNVEGSLTTFFLKRGRQPVILPGHQDREHFPATTPGDTESRVKHYGLTDVKFCPADPTRFVSSGNDGNVKVWLRYREEPWHVTHLIHKFPQGVPQTLLFKPESVTLAVAERSIFIFPDVRRNVKPTRLEGGREPGQIVGEMRWGHGHTKGLLFASSEPTDQKQFNGSWHRIYDLTRQKVAVRFRDDEAGDAMALDAAGDRLAIVTRNSPTNSTLRIYDVRNKDPNPVQEIELEPFKLMDEDDEDEAGEHRGAQFSPDGVFIALARYDNCVHVYDSRFIKSKGLLYNFQHSAVTRINPGIAPYGVSNLEWVYKDSRLGLVSGGSDGCVRLWNPLEAASNPKNGKPLVTVNSDIATFSLGDRFKGEHQLVVGDCAGEVSIFDQFLDTDFPYR